MNVTKVAVPLVAAAHRGSHRFDDHDVSHGFTCSFVRGANLSSGGRVSR